MRSSPVTNMLVSGTMPRQAAEPWLSIVPIAESRSSYNGLIILVFLVVSGTLTAMVIHRFATRATRRSAIWDCGFPLDAPQTQYAGASFAMPIRRVFGTVVFGVREHVDMPRPGEMRAGQLSRARARSGLALCLWPDRAAPSDRCRCRSIGCSSSPSAAI